MQTSVRQLKAQLSRLLKRVEAGATVTVSVHNRPIAEIVPIRRKRSVKELAGEPGIAWNGKKPVGVTRGETVPEGISVSEWVVEDRR
jgi:prevent-host-death family protein